MESRPLNTFSPAPLPAPPAQPAVGLPYSEFSQMMANEPPAGSGLIDPEAATAAAPPLPSEDAAARITTEPAMPEFTLRASAPPTPRLDFSAPPIEVAPGPAPSGKPRRLFRRESSIGQPSETHAVDFGVRLRGAHVVLLQPVHPRQQRLYVGAVHGAQPGKQTLLLVRRVLRGGFAEVTQRRVPGSALLAAERLAVRLRGHVDQHRQKALHAPVAIAEQSDGVGKAAFPFGADYDGHRCFPHDRSWESRAGWG